MTDYATVKLRKRKVPIKYEDVSSLSQRNNETFLNHNNNNNGDKKKKILKLPDDICNGALVRIKMIKSKSQDYGSTYRLLVGVKKEEKRSVTKKTKKNKQSRSIRKSKTTSTSHHGRPTIEECDFVTKALAALHPEVVDRNDELRRKTMLESCGMRNSVTEAIVSTMLSQNTTDANSKAAFAKLKRTFGRQQKINTISIDWDDVAHPDNLNKLENAIRVAGLAKTRSERIQKMLQMVQAEHNGSTSIDYLREWTDDERIKKELVRFPGLGPKAISCVLLFALNRPEFPVDTHVLRICQLMGWVSHSHNRITAYEHLNAKVPNNLKMDLHCLLVAHGKHCHYCAANHRPQFPPTDGTKLPCPLKHISKWKGILPIITTTDKLEKIKLEPQDDITPDHIVSNGAKPLNNTIRVKK